MKKFKLDYQAGGWYINGCRASKAMALVKGEWYVFDGMGQDADGGILVDLLNKDGGDFAVPLGMIDDIQEI